jgi:hypothetical protein
MYAYAGTYKLEGQVLVSAISTSWNQSWTGRTQRRKVTLQGNVLTVETDPFRTQIDGREVVVTATYERVE